MRVLLRGITVGTAVGLALGYKHSDGYDRERIARLWEAGGQYTILGGAFGAGCVCATRVLRAPAAVAGAVYGLGVWWGIEHWYGRISDGRNRWGFPPPQKTAAALALYGAAVGGSLSADSGRKR